MVRRLRRALAAVALGLALLAVSVPSASATPSGEIANVHALPGQVQFLFSARDVPPGASLNARSVRVSISGTALEATVQQTGAKALRKSATRTAILVLDVSGSMAGSGLAAERAAAIEYVRNVPDDVGIGLVTFSTSPRVVVVPTVDRTRLLAELRKVRAGGNTALYDAIGSALGRFASSFGAGEARLLILSDGADTSSKRSLSTTLSVLRGGKVSTDVVALGAKADRRILGLLAAAGHGRMSSAQSSTELASAFGKAARSFSEQVLVTATIPPQLSGKQGQLRVELSASGRTSSTVQDLSLPGVSSPAPLARTTARPVKPASGTIILPVLLILTFCGLLALPLCFVALSSPSEAQSSTRRRIAEVGRYRLDPSTPAGGAGQQGASSLTESALSYIDRFLRRRGTTSTIAGNLDRAGLRLRPQEWILLRISSGIVLTAVIFLLTNSLPVGLLLGFLAGWLGTKVFLGFKMARRCSAFADQLPDTLQLVASSLRSGFSLLQALDGVVHEGTEPAASELSRALSDGRLGVDIEDALDKVAERMRSTDLSWVVMAVRISREVGGNLAEVLMTTVQTMRERAQVRRQVRALSAEGRLSGVILVGMPILIAGWLYVSRPDYLRPLYTDPLGLAMLGAGILSLCIGGWWMSKLVKIEV